MASNLKQSKTSSDERATGGTHVLVAVACTVVYQNVETHSMTETWTKQILHYSHFQIKKIRQLFTNLGVMFRRKGGKDGLTITKSTEACELHFKPDEIKTLGRGIKTLKTGMEVPSIYSFK